MCDVYVGVCMWCEVCVSGVYLYVCGILCVLCVCVWRLVCVWVCGVCVVWYVCVISVWYMCVCVHMCGVCIVWGVSACAHACAGYV